ncbi:DUF3570 domain-containing protein [Fibrobacterota bacterium]
MLRKYLPAYLILFGFFMRAFSGEVDHISYKFQYYDDNNDVNIISNTTSISKGLGEHVRVNLSYLVDGITGASRNDDRGAIDGITSASQTDERRHEVKGGLTVNFDWLLLFNKEKETEDPMFITVTGINSQEDDYTSRTISAAISQDLFQRNTTIGASYTKSFDDYDPAERFVPGATDEGWDYIGGGKRETDRISASITQGITTTTIASVIWGYVFDRGYLSRPYYVYSIGDQWYHENLPPERKIMTVTGRLNQYIPTSNGTAAHLDYRVYFDSWDIMSHTVSLKFYYRPAEKFIINPSYRFYTQNSAFFYQDVYSSVPTYLTTDFKFRECITNTIGLNLIYEVKDLFKPEDAPFFSLFPVNFNIAANYMMRTGTNVPQVIEDHYSYWGDRYQNFWIQTGIKLSF